MPKLSKKLINHALLLAIFVAGFITDQAQAIDTQFFSSNDILFYNPEAAVCSGSTGNPSASTSTNGAGQEIEVGASIYGGHWTGSSFVRDPGDDNGTSATGPLAGRPVFAELSGSEGRFRALADAMNLPQDQRDSYGGFPQRTRFKITFNGKSIIAEKGDVGGGGGDVQGKVRAVDLWYQTAELLDFKEGLGVVKIQQVPKDTPLTPIGGAAATDDSTSAPSAPSSAVCCVASAPGAVTGSPAANLSGSTNQEKIWNYLRSRGLSPEQTAGIMGNFSQESGFSPVIQESRQSWPRGGWGLAQWTGSRRTQIANALSKNAADVSKYYDNAYGSGKDTKADGTSDRVPVTDNDKLIAFELQFLEQESTSRPVTAKKYGSASSEWELLRQQTTVDSATRFWHANYEVSADKGPGVDERVADAKKILTQFGGNAVAASGACAGGATGDVTGIQATIKQYAWPTYHSAPYSAQQPAYKAAMDKAVSEGRFVGGNRGNDCGGFVTTLIYDSGWDKNYNYSAKGGNTVTQKKWLDANWRVIGTGNKINVADLQPGDVAMQPGHTYVYAGTIDGFSSKIASASVGGPRSPMAGKENPAQADTTWYRKKG